MTKLIVGLFICVGIAFGQGGASTFPPGGSSSSAGVLTFNTRNGAVLLTQSDINFANGLSMFNIASYGAICDGTNHLASSKFANLTATRVVYPFATAQTNTLDWLGAYAAINAAIVNGATSRSGGTVFSAAVTCVFSNASSATDGTTALPLPEANNYVGGGISVNLLGAGKGITEWTWPFPLASGVCAIADTNRTTTATGNFGLISDMELIGPAENGLTIGTSPSVMNGLCVGPFRDVKRLRISYFRGGLDYAGGQQRFEDVTLENNYYNIYVRNQAGGLTGDVAFTRLVSKNAELACFGIAHDARLVDSTFDGSPYCGTSPFVFLKETNSGSPSVPDVMASVTFIQPKFEQIGNALIADDRNSAAPVAQMEDVSMQLPWFSWSNTFKYASYTRFAVIVTANTSRVEITGLRNIGGWVPGTAGIFNFTSPSGVTLAGDINNLIVNAIAAGTSANYVIANWPYGNGAITFHNTANSFWDGTIAYAGAAGLTAGQIVNQAPIDSYASQVKATGGNTADAPAGIVMHSSGTGAQFTAIIYAYAGQVSVKSSGTWQAATSQNPQFVRTGSSGNAIQATNSADVTSPMIGVLYHYTGSTTPSTVDVKLQQLQ